MANPNDKAFYKRTLAIQKAINAIETPVKEKHVRSTLIGTFQEQSAVTYWMVAVRLPLQDNRIVAWKFCHVTHKLLREGHPACLDDSQRHIDMIENLGMLWVHLREGYGKLVHLYCDLLVCKLKFHSRNPRFPGNMQLTADELDAIAENDVNNYFQLCVELFDYMDGILSLQAAVFDSLGNARANSMTASGQCRLAALIPCAQDASQLYDCNVRLLFRLHAALPVDTLAGHRDRFQQQFKKLSSFYKHASSLQYYRNLLTLPVLPSNPPNFLLQSDFGTYVTPVVTIPEPPPDEVDSVGSLIDTSDTISQAASEHFEEFDAAPATVSSPQSDPIVERDQLIDHLQNELKRMRLEASQLVQERNTMMESMREYSSRIDRELSLAETVIEMEKGKAVSSSEQLTEIKEKLTETEEKAKLTDEKFQKLKGAYTQLREEHIKLIRQKAEVDKLAANLKATTAQNESAKLSLQQQLNDRIKDVDMLQQSASSSEAIEAYENQISTLRTELDQAKQKEVELETVKASIEALEIEHTNSAKENEEKITKIATELRETKECLEQMKQEKEAKEIELNRVTEELVGLKDKSLGEYMKIVNERDAMLEHVEKITQQREQDKKELTQSNSCVNKLQTEIDSLQHKLSMAQTDYTVQCQKLSQELAAKQQDLDDTINAKDSEIKEALNKLKQVQSDLDATKLNYVIRLEEKSSELSSLQDKINELEEYKNTAESLKTEFLNEKCESSVLLKAVIKEKDEIQETLSEKLNEISNMEIKLTELDNSKNKEILELKEALHKVMADKDYEVCELNKMLDEKSQLSDRIKLEGDKLSRKIVELETSIEEKNKHIEVLNIKMNETVSSIDKQRLEYENKQKDNNYEITILKDKLLNITECKDEIIANLKNMVAEKDEQVISMNIEVAKLTEENSRLKEELTETHAELEIGNNELISMKEEHETIVQRNENNLTMKNQELRDLYDKINELNNDITNLQEQKQKLVTEYDLEKQVLESKIEENKEVYTKLTEDYNTLQTEKESLSVELNNELGKVKFEYQQLKDVKNNEIELLNKKITTQECEFTEKISQKDVVIGRAEADLHNLKGQLMELEISMSKEKEDMESVITEKDRDKQMLEARLTHTEGEKLKVECELQDLLQHNTALEDDLAHVKKQLEELQEALGKQTAKLVTCAGEVALEVTQEAIAALDQASAQDSVNSTAQLAVKAFEQLARHNKIKGNEEEVARSAMLVAHSVAKLSAYVAEITNVSIDVELADKLNNESSSMLSATKQCLESIKEGTVESSACSSARGLVETVARAAAAASRPAAAARSVDDELAEMDQAIELAASQIEEMLAATRAGDSGVKLEVNGKILDACTTLMGAVKILVQDARKLQNELGDPKTRQKMYRKNPQWSEGLISAAKAVVFAAKLLVTSADEAVGGSGQTEGVSAAAHEVAGSTAQLVAASRARAAPASPALARLAGSSRAVAAATGAVLAAVKAGSTLALEQEALDTSALTLTATRRLEMESKVRSLKLETALEAERARLAALRKRHYQLAQLEENGNMEDKV